ncbi:hypothetical protein ACFL96_06430 [Thermoproteota archaeon]
MKNRLYHNKGSAIVFATAIIAIICVITVHLLSTAVTSIRASESAKNSSFALAAARQGMNRLYHKIDYNDWTDVEVGHVVTIAGGGTYEILKIETSPFTISLVVKGTFGGITRIIERMLFKNTLSTVLSAEEFGVDGLTLSLVGFTGISREFGTFAAIQGRDEPFCQINFKAADVPFVKYNEPNRAKLIPEAADFRQEYEDFKDNIVANHSADVEVVELNFEVQGDVPPPGTPINITLADYPAEKDLLIFINEKPGVDLGTTEFFIGQGGETLEQESLTVIVISDAHPLVETGFNFKSTSGDVDPKDKKNATFIGSGDTAFIARYDIMDPITSFPEIDVNFRGYTVDGTIFFQLPLVPETCISAYGISETGLVVVATPDVVGQTVAATFNPPYTDPHSWFDSGNIVAAALLGDGLIAVGPTTNSQLIRNPENIPDSFKQKRYQEDKVIPIP